MAITCTSWYLVTTYYDGYGNTTGSSSQFLYTSCSGDLGDYPEPDHGGPVDCAGVLAGGLICLIVVVLEVQQVLLHAP
ncbi:hypothetical protein QFZ20_000030 [Flavobacterium sp. W4I14]|nr:hypothetical protein [Flavobacterium sp. W4I14]